MHKIKPKITIGRLEKIDLPELSLYNLDAKVDTGAYTSSLHCHSVHTEKRDDKLWVTFYVLDPGHPEYEGKFFESPVSKIKKVKSSNGLIEERVIIRQKSMFFGQPKIIELSLADRTDMKYPVLLGRKFLSGKFIVDVSGKFLFKTY
ncbi:MAG: RimK/LysX family protein [Balneolaceae bacterium]